MTESDPTPQIGALDVADIVLPEPVDRLHDLVYNLWWTWSAPAKRLFGTIDTASWIRYRNPVEVLLNVDPHRWELLIDSDSFMQGYTGVIRQLDDYMDASRTTWRTERQAAPASGPVAYFSMEYGLHQALSIYSGGLGVLSGDHLKTASDLGIPMVAVGLMYRCGYFHQALDADGFQQHLYPEVDFQRLPVRPALDPRGRALTVKVPVPSGEIVAKAWLAQVGRVPLILLDTDVPENDPADRPIGSVLYVRGREMRLLQEMVLGIGGVKVLETLGVRPSVWHINEGHSSLLQLERMAAEIEAGASPEAAMESVRASTVFTTHTPVPAGNEQYDRRLAEIYLQPWAERLGKPVEAVLDLGAADHGEPEQPLNLSAFALRTCSYANGVSRLNAEVADRMWRHLFPDTPEGEPVIDAITNGVHLPTWLGREVQGLFERRLGADWRNALHLPESWAAMEELDLQELWEAHSLQKDRLMHFVRNRTRAQMGRHGRPPGDLRAMAEQIRSGALTIGFARRFATYKRAGLLFSDLHRLRNLLANSDQPLQIFVAGKAHPADRPGQELIRHIFQLSQEPGLRGRIVFLEDYDLRVARKLVQGVDLWLNTPRRLMEASGTSGMKAAANGVLNCSILDGWWPEAFDGENGWAIGPPEPRGEDWDDDAQDALALYQLLEEEILPLYFERDDDGMPRAWTERMRRSLVTVGRQFSSNRMLQQYHDRAYAPRLAPSVGDEPSHTEVASGDR